jgi:hypothetical protein
MIEVAEKQVSNAQRIRDYIKEHPFAKAKTIAEALKLPSTYVHSTMWAERKKAKAKKVTLNISQLELAKKLGITAKQYAEGLLAEQKKKPIKKPKVVKKPEMKKFLGVTIAKDDITNLTDEQVSRLVANLGKPKQRMLEPVQIEMFEPKADPVNHPAHYKVGGIETIDFIEAKKLNYNLGNVVKYLTRADHKGNRKQDLEKAKWYLERELSTTI